MKRIKIQFYITPVGELVIGDFENNLCLCDWRYRRMRNTIDIRIKQGFDAEYYEEDSELIRETKYQLDSYFEGKQTAFNLPLKFVGTGFQKSVWNQLLKIPFGKTETYFSLSQKLKNEKAIRAVAAANGANAIAIVVPCHRVIGSNGELTGYAGGLNVKKKLLQIENSKVDQLELFEI